MKEVAISRGYRALVDDEDYELVTQFRWFANVRTHTVYAATHVYKDGKRTTITMHRMLCSTEHEVDHKDWNGLNNCKANLVPATRRQNAGNRKTCKLGVHWYSQRSKWRAMPYINGCRVYLGLFDTEAGAIAAVTRTLTKQSE